MVRVLSDEKGLETEVVFEALEFALAAAARRDYREDIDVRVQIDRADGSYETFRRWEVVELNGEDDQEQDQDEEQDQDDEQEQGLEFPDRQLTPEQALERGEKVDIGDFVEEKIPSTGIGRISAQTAKQVIMQKVREAERARIIEEYQPKVGSMVFGQVKRMERGDAIVEIDGVDAILFRSLSIPRDGLRTGDRIRAILKEVRSETRGPSLVLDRTSPELLVHLFRLEVPETREGLVEIICAARDPGQRAKIAVHSDDPKVDPIGACVGVRGARVQSVSGEIANERIDIVKWSPNAVQFVINALAPAVVQGMDVNEESHSMNVVVSDEELSQAIGRSGQNVRLATDLTGWTLNIMTQSQADDKSAEENLKRQSSLMSELNVDDYVAEILVQEHYYSLDDIVYSSKENLMKIEEFDEKLVDEIIDRAQNALLAEAISRSEASEDESPRDDLLGMEGMDEETAWLLARNGIRSMEDLANCASDELEELNIDEERASALIMKAREPWFEEPESEPDPEEESEA